MGIFPRIPPSITPRPGTSSAKLDPPRPDHAKTKHILALNLFPTPNVTPQPGYNTVARLGSPDNVNQVNTREDYNISEKDTLYARLSYTSQNNISPGLAPLSGTIYQQKGWNAGLSEIHLFSPHIVNDLRLGFNRPPRLLNSMGPLGRISPGKCFRGGQRIRRRTESEFLFSELFGAGGTVAARWITGRIPSARWMGSPSPRQAFA